MDKRDKREGEMEEGREGEKEGKKEGEEGKRQIGWSGVKVLVVMRVWANDS